MRASGFTIVELMITLVIAGVLLGLGISSFNTLMADSQTRSVAESMMSGLRLARAEAIKRNVPMRFQLVSTIDSGCQNSNNGKFWVVTQYDQTYDSLSVAQGHCDSQPYTPPDQPDICNPVVVACSVTVQSNCRGIASATNPSPGSCSADPLIAFKSDLLSYPNVNVNGTSFTAGGAAAFVVTFSPLGRVSPNTQGGNSLTQIDLTNSVGSKAWRIQIASVSGSLRMCDPSAASTTGLSCPAPQ